MLLARALDKQHAMNEYKNISVKQTKISLFDISNKSKTLRNGNLLAHSSSLSGGFESEKI